QNGTAVLIKLQTVSHRTLRIGIIQIHHQGPILTMLPAVLYPYAGIGLIDQRARAARQAKESMTHANDRGIPLDGLNLARRLLQTETQQGPRSQTQNGQLV